MSPWVVLAIFASLYVGLVILAVGVYIGERHQAQLMARAGVLFWQRREARR